MAKKLISVFLVMMILSASAFGQSNLSDALSSSSPKKQMTTIIFSGLAGAALGVSTLSFYSEPQDNLSNITIGFALGIIAGATYTTYKAATEPYSYLEVKSLFNQDRLFTFNQGHTVGYAWSF